MAIPVRIQCMWDNKYEIKIKGGCSITLKIVRNAKKSIRISAFTSDKR